MTTTKQWNTPLSVFKTKLSLLFRDPVPLDDIKMITIKLFVYLFVLGRLSVPPPLVRRHTRVVSLFYDLTIEITLISAPVSWGHSQYQYHSQHMDLVYSQTLGNWDKWDNLIGHWTAK